MTFFMVAYGIFKFAELLWYSGLDWTKTQDAFFLGIGIIAIILSVIGLCYIVQSMRSKSSISTRYSWRILMI